MPKVWFKFKENFEIHERWWNYNKHFAIYCLMSKSHFDKVELWNDSHNGIFFWRMVGSHQTDFCYLLSNSISKVWLSRELSLLQYFGHLMQRVDSLEKTLILGGGDNRQWDGWMTFRTRWTWVWANSGSWWWTGKPGMLQSIGSQSQTTEQLNWTEWMTLGLSRWH